MSSSNMVAAGARGWTTKQLAWGCIGSFAAGAIALYAVGFHWVGQWQTGAEVGKKLAVAACVQDFLLQPDRGVVYTQLKDNSSSFQRTPADPRAQVGGRSRRRGAVRHADPRAGPCPARDARDRGSRDQAAGVRRLGSR